ncbi:MAG TPA: hypothetical protein VHH35_05765 [Pyrinomonadaceae bacterium]|nr:hypothetical protein [Pyrinomonadaceae bacterium]
MSDFLTNLVMRSFAQTPSVQPMTLSAYAAPEPPQIETVEPSVEPQLVKNTDDRKSVIEEAPIPKTTLKTSSKTSPKTFPEIEHPIVPADHSPDSDLPERELTHTSVVQPVHMSKPDQTIAPPVQTPQRVVKPAVQVQKVAEPLIVEQVIEHVVERPTVKSIERPTVTTIENSTTETIERPSVTSIERSIEQSSITIENTEHVTNSFTTLVPKVTPQQPLPALSRRPRAIAPPAETAAEEQDQAQTTSPETVINVAIGRIEVRATPAPTSRRERQNGPKMMTLDDYLQQRSRGAQ